MPWSEHLKFLEKYALDLGGTVGSLGIQNERSVFYSQDKKIKAAPVICYESIYGEFVSEYVKNGANVICVITNDGWWRNTAGYKQHFAMPRCGLLKQGVPLCNQPIQVFQDLSINGVMCSKELDGGKGMYYNRMFC